MPSLLRAELVINEILFNPPGSTDIPNEYIELRGTPNLVLPLGTYLVCVEGDTNNPGTIQNVFDLSGRVVGGNGFLVLLQKTNSYSFNTNATILVNTDTGSGFGNGSTSSIGHRGEGNQTDLENGSETFFLIQSTNFPAIGLDIDSDNNGVPDGTLYASWVILDSVGILGATGQGDIAYGAINFRRNPAALASGTIVPVTFTPSYVGRTGNTIGSAASAWVASDNLGGTVPNWTLGSSGNTAPPSDALLALNHIGGPNFGAPPIPGVLVWESGGSTDVREGTGTDFYTISLNTAPSGNVTIQIAAQGQVQVSVDNGVSYGSTRTVTLANTSPKTVLVRALIDDVLDTAIHPVAIRHSISATLDSTHYATTNLVASVNVNVTETKNVLLSEIKANPPGPIDGPYEYVELRGEPSLLLTNLYFIAVDGNVSGNPGVADVVINLSNTRLGSSGLLVLGGFNSPYAIPFGTTFVPDAKFDAPSGALSNNTVSFLLVSSPKPIQEGDDLDAGDNGILEGLSKNATILDAVGWSDGDNNDIVYGGVILTQSSGVPDAASRFEYDDTPLSAAAWYNGDLLGTDPGSIQYDDNGASANFPSGATLTPGVYANLEPSIAGLRPFSGVIGDPTNPGLTFQLRDPDSAPSTLQLTVFSSNQVVVPDGNLTLVSGAGGFRTLFLNPTGVGYSWIRLVITDDDLVVTQSFLYAASARGPAGTFFHSGMSDASAAFALDANYMWVGDDENQTLKLYDRHRSGEPIAGINFDSFLGLTDTENGIPREVDIEGSTHVGNRIFWIGSHSLSSEADARPNRSRMFATDFIGSGTNATLVYRGRYDFFKEDLAAWDSGNFHGKGANYYGIFASEQAGVDPKAPDGSGFNIEGLCMAPASTTVGYIALRAPIVPATNRNYALIVPVLNFTALAGTNLPPGSAVFGAPIELDLYGRGIRSIEGSDAGYLIVGGPAASHTANYPADFRLYTWTGSPSDIPGQLSANLAGMNPESIVEIPAAPWTSNTLVQLLSDNGTVVFYNDDIEAKHLPFPAFKKFRDDWVSMGSIVKPAPIIREMRLVGSNLTITWRALRGETYRVQSCSTIPSPGWADIAGDVLATGPLASKTFLVTGSPRFYQVKVLP